MKTKRCKHCGTEFKPSRPMQKVCCWQCSIAYAKAETDKQVRKAVRARLHEMKTLSELHKEAQAAFNKFIRYRDKGQPCISCQRVHKGQIHAGHFRSVGAAKQLRYVEDNCHAQCKPCNTDKSGNLLEYRKHLITKVGEARVIELENDNTVKKWTREEIIEIKKLYTRKAKELGT